MAPCAFVLPAATRHVDVNVSQYQVKSPLDVAVIGRSPSPGLLDVRRSQPRWELALVSTGVAACASNNCNLPIILAVSLVGMPTVPFLQQLLIR